MGDAALTLKRTGSGRVRLLFVLASLTLALVIVGPYFLDRFALNVLTRSMSFAILAITVDLLWGYTGILTFGQSAFFGIGAYATALTLTHIGGSPVLIGLALLLAILVPMIVGVAVGWLTFYHGSSDFYATIISLVVPIIVVQVIFSGGTWTGSSSGLVGYYGINLGLDGFFRLVGIVLVLVTLAALVFVRSDAGRVLKAIRDNQTRCAYLGINTYQIKIVLTAVLGGVAGLAGFLYANASGVVAPENAGFVFGTELVIWTALGGRGTIIGPIIGTIGIGYLSAQLSGDLPFLWQLIIGTLFVVMIIFLPNGLAALVTGFTKRRKRNVAPPTLVPVREERAHDTGSAPLLVVEGLQKSFGSLKVLEDISLTVKPGELVSLVGPNGAGKTTMMRCLTDGTEASGGTVRIHGHDITGLAPNKIVAFGVGRKFQIASVFESLSVAECLRMARTTLDRPSLTGAADRLALPSPALDVLNLTGLNRHLTDSVGMLSHGQKQSLELAMVLALQPDLILLDEPTAGLTKAERTMIGDVLKTLTNELGIAAILVEHDLDFVRDISSRIVVLHRGRLLLDGTVEEVVEDELVKKIYSGASHD